MLKERDESKAPSNNKQLQEDFQYLLSSIRARQNSFFYYLDRFKSFLLLGNTQDFQISRNQFQQKEKIYTKQINGVIAKYFQTATGNIHQVRTFWIKLRSIIKVSIDRVKQKSLANQQILQHYQKALICINRNTDMEKGIIAFKQVQNHLKKKTIEGISLGRASSPNSMSYSQSKIAKNRSQTLFKADIVSGFTLQQNKSNIFSNGGQTAILNKDRYSKINKFEQLQNIQQQRQFSIHPKMKSLNRQRFKRDNYAKANMLNFLKFQHLHKQKSVKTSEKRLKKLSKHIDRYNKALEGALEGKHQFLFDKKKTISQNIYSIYDSLFERNIPNHKMISKFMYNTTKINQIIYSAYEKKKKIKKQKQKEKEKEKEKEKQKQKQKNVKQVKQKEKPKQKQRQKQRQKQKEYIMKQKQHYMKQKDIQEGKSIKNNHRKLHLQKLQTLQLPHKPTNSIATTVAQQKKTLRPKTVKIKVNSFNGNQIMRVPGSANGKRQKMVNALC